MIASAPGKLILTGEYAVLDGAPSIVVAVDRRAVAKIDASPRGSSPFLLAVADEIAARRGASDPATQAAMQISVDSAAFYDTTRRGAAAAVMRGSITAQLAAASPTAPPPDARLVESTKLGLGSSAAVTVAATALALSSNDKQEILEVALAAHARAQGPRGSRGSGADIAASVYGGTIVFSRPPGAEQTACQIAPQRWPSQVQLVPFFTGVAADTAPLVARVQQARETDRPAVEAALAAITDASRAAVAALTAPAELATVALIGALALAAHATDQLAAATQLPLVPDCVRAARAAFSRLGGTAKTTGAGGGDVAIVVVPADVDATTIARLIIEAGGQPLRLARDEVGVELRADAS